MTVPAAVCTEEFLCVDESQSLGKPRRRQYKNALAYAYKVISQKTCFDAALQNVLCEEAAFYGSTAKSEKAQRLFGVPVFAVRRGKNLPRQSKLIAAVFYIYSL